MRFLEGPKQAEQDAKDEDERKSREAPRKEIQFDERWR